MFFFKKDYFFKVILVFIALSMVMSKANALNLSNKTNYWSFITLQDLKATRDYIEELHPGLNGYPDPHFKQWFNEGYQTAWQRAKEVNSYGGYITVMRYYTNGFQDIHLRVQPLLTHTQVRWPGFLVIKQNESYIVAYRDKNYHYEMPALGAVLLGCNGSTPEELLKQNVLPYYRANAKSGLGWELFSPYMFVDQDNPWFKKPSSCVFQERKIQKTYPLEWMPITTREIDPLIAELPFGKTPSFTIDDFGKNSVWISLPAFAEGSSKVFYGDWQGVLEPLFFVHNKQTASFMDNINKTIQNYREKDNIVFDLRGNGGGYDYNWKGLFSIFYGEYLKTLSDSALQGTIPNPIKGHVFLLTDGRCASACWLFVRAARQIPGVIQIGQPTHTNHIYGSMAHLSLPSGLSFLDVSTNICNSKEKSDFGKPFIPDYVYQGNMGETGALKKWVLTLSKNDVQAKHGPSGKLTDYICIKSPPSPDKIKAILKEIEQTK